MTTREWDTRSVWNVRHERWWWNAWREGTGTELWGFTDSQEDALRAIATAIQQETQNRLPSSIQPMQF